MLLEYAMEIAIHVFRSHVPQAKHYDTRKARSASGNEFSEIQIVGKKNEAFVPCLCEDSLIF